MAHVQASLSDISAEDFKKAVTSTPLAGENLSHSVEVKAKITIQISPVSKFDCAHPPF